MLNRTNPKISTCFTENKSRFIYLLTHPIYLPSSLANSPIFKDSGLRMKISKVTISFISIHYLQTFIILVCDNDRLMYK